MEPSLAQSAAGPTVPQGRRDTLAEPEVGKELEKILSSEGFRDAEGLKRFLRYTVEHTLHGEGSQLKEYRLGVEVFNRDSSFDPRVDPVVRMTARRLRSKLKQYYESEGIQDPIWIDVPKGSYAAAFSRNASKQLSIVGVVKPSRSRKYAWLAGIGLVLLFAAVVGTAVYRIRDRQLQSAAPAQHPSLAVLPLLNLTGSTDNEYLCDGVTDELTSALSKLPGVRVVARTSAFRFKNKPEDVRSIGEQLNVTSILEGSLQKSGERLRITVQLIRAADGYHVWSQTYDRNSGDAFAVEDEITQTIAATLRIRLAQGPQVEALRRTDAEAHELNLRGRYWLNRRTPPDLWKAIAYFNQALEKDPAYAQAYLGLAEAYSTLGANDQASPREVLPKARAAAQQALRWDDALGEAHAVFAWVTFLDGWNSALAEQEFRRALQLSPNYATAHQWFGLTLMLQQRFAESLRQFNLAQDLDPLSLILSTDKGVVYYYSGQQDKASEEAHRILAHDADFADAHLLLGMAQEKQGQFKMAEQEIGIYLEVSGQDPDALMKLGVAYAHAGDRARALQMITKMRKPTTGQYVPFYYIADIYAALGDKEAAFEWLDRALDQHSNSCLLLAIDPAFENLRSDRRFQEAARRIGLPHQTTPS